MIFPSHVLFSSFCSSFTFDFSTLSLSIFLPHPQFLSLSSSLWSPVPEFLSQYHPFTSILVILHTVFPIFSQALPHIFHWDFCHLFVYCSLSLCIDTPLYVRRAHVPPSDATSIFVQFLTQLCVCNGTILAMRAFEKPTGRTDRRCWFIPPCVVARTARGYWSVPGPTRISGAMCVLVAAFLGKFLSWPSIIRSLFLYYCIVCDVASAIFSFHISSPNPFLFLFVCVLVFDVILLFQISLDHACKSVLYCARIVNILIMCFHLVCVQSGQTALVFARVLGKAEIVRLLTVRIYASFWYALIAGDIIHHKHGLHYCR